MPTYNVTKDGKTYKIKSSRELSRDELLSAISGDSVAPQQSSMQETKSPDYASNIEKGDEKIDEDQNFLFDVLDQANRPQYGVANVIHKAVIDKDYNVAKNYWDGLSLDEKKSVGDTLQELVKPESTFGKAAVAAAGFAGDVLTDPLTYTGVGLVNRGGKLLKAGTKAERFAKAGRAMGGAEDTKAVLTATYPSLKQTEKGIRPTLKTKTFDPSFKEPLLGKEVNPIDMASRGIAKAGKALREDAGVLSEGLELLTGISTKFRPKGIDNVTWERLLRAKEKANVVGDAAKVSAITKSKTLYKKLQDEGLNDEQIEELVDTLETGRGVKSESGKYAKQLQKEYGESYKNIGPSGKELIDEEGYEYLPHVLSKKSKEFRDAVGEVGFKKRVMSTANPSDLKRTLLKYTDDAGEEFVLSTKTGLLMKEGEKAGKLTKKQLEKTIDGKFGKTEQATIREVNKAFGEPVFSKKLPELMAVQGFRQAKAIKGDTFFKEVMPLASKGPVSKNGVEYVESTAPELAGKYFDPEVVKHIDETYKMYSNPDEINSAVKVWDTINNAWKTNATVIYPSFHTRNAISNVFQNALAGVRNPLDYKRAIDIQSSKDLSKADAKILEEYKAQGLQNVGQLSGDIEQTFEKEIMGVFDNFKKGKVIAGTVKAGRNTGDFVETNAKLAHFIAKRKEGLTPFEAGQSVKKYLFDYSDITNKEKFLKKIMPFYTFTRKNLPIQIEALVKDPSKQTKIIKMKNNVEVMTNEDSNTEILPDWLKDAAPVFVGRKDGKVRYIKLEGFLGAADMNKLSLTKGAQDLLNMVSPIIKAPVEQVANKNFFFGDELTRQKGLKGFTGYGEKDFLWTRIPGRLDHMARLFRTFSEIEKFVGKRAQTQTGVQKAFNIALGGKLYEYDERELLKYFDLSTEDEARGMKRQINKLKRQIEKHPEFRKANIKQIKELYRLMGKEKQEAAKKRAAVRRKM